MPAADRESGMILINVLLFVAIASAVVLLMVTAEESALHRSGRLIEASHARAAALGGELSAIAALRRDAVAAPDTDNSTEPWARIGQKNVAIQGGRFELAVADAEDRFNINLLIKGDPAGLALGGKIADAIGLSQDQLVGAVQYLRIAGPVSDLGALERVGLPPVTITRLERLVTPLPGDSHIDLNSVNEDLLGIMIGDPAAAHILIAVRARQGYLTPQDLLVQHVPQPPLSAYASNFFWVRTRVTIGDTSQQLTSLVRRRRDGRQLYVEPIARWWGAYPPPQAPAL